MDLVCLGPIRCIQIYWKDHASGTCRQVSHIPIGHSESPWERFKEDLKFCELFIANIHNATRLNISIPDWVDTISQALAEPAAKQDAVSFLWQSFSLLMVLDIRHVLQNHESDAFLELQATGKRAAEIIR
jgi:hypothetical protein